MRFNRSMPAATVMPVLEYDDLDEAIAWLRGAFGCEVRWQAGSHRAQLAVGDGCVVASERYEELGLGGVLVRVEDVDAHFERAVAHRAYIEKPPANHEYGERQYTALDLRGHRWTFSETIADVAPEAWGGRSGPALEPPAI
jgi:uncharacterized glyoxalase superfamily protein PhnB